MALLQADGRRHAGSAGRQRPDPQGAPQRQQRLLTLQTQEEKGVHGDELKRRFVGWRAGD